MTWLGEVLGDCVLTPRVEDYLLGRGAKEESIQAEGAVTWQVPEKDIPDAIFRQRYGPRGEKLSGWLICPVYSPKGALLGFEGRNTQQKMITDFRLPASKWSPFWLGTRRMMSRIWAGGDVWVVEGLFDLFPLEWVVPETDAVLASVRAKLSRQHVAFLRRFCKGWVHMVYDRDETGRKGTVGFVDDTGKRVWGALESLEHAGLRCRDVTYRGGNDPGEIWDSGGVEALNAAFVL